MNPNTQSIIASFASKGATQTVQREKKSTPSGRGNKVGQERPCPITIAWSEKPSFMERLRARHISNVKTGQTQKKKVSAVPSEEIVAKFNKFMASPQTPCSTPRFGGNSNPSHNLEEDLVRVALALSLQEQKNE